MSSARKVLGVILLFATVGVASCQGLFNERAPSAPLTSPQLERLPAR